MYIKIKKYITNKTDKMVCKTCSLRKSPSFILLFFKYG